MQSYVDGLCLQAYAPDWHTAQGRRQQGSGTRTKPMGTIAMMGTPYGSDIGISPGSTPWNVPGSPGGGCCPCGAAAAADADATPSGACAA